MKLSEATLIFLKNFAAINDGVVLRTGKMQKTMATDRSVLVEAEFEEEIPKEFGIYDLSQFLGNVTTLNNPDLTFRDNDVLMDDGSIKLTYRACSPSLVVTPPDKKLELKSADVAFDLSATALQKMLKIAAMNNFPILTVVGKDGKISLVTSEDNDTSNTAEMVLADYTGDDVAFKFKTEHLNMIPGDYGVQVQKGAFALFGSKNYPINYFVAIQSK